MMDAASVRSSLLGAVARHQLSETELEALADPLGAATHAGALRARLGLSEADAAAVAAEAQRLLSTGYEEVSRQLVAGAPELPASAALPSLDTAELVGRPGVALGPEASRPTNAQLVEAAVGHLRALIAGGRLDRAGAEQLLATFALALSTTRADGEESAWLSTFRSVVERLSVSGLVAGGLGGNVAERAALVQELDLMVLQRARVLGLSTRQPASPKPGGSTEASMLEQWIVQCEKYGSIDSVAAEAMLQLFHRQVMGAHNPDDVRAGYGVLDQRLRAANLAYTAPPRASPLPPTMEAFSRTLRDTALDRIGGLRAESALGQLFGELLPSGGQEGAWAVAERTLRDVVGSGAVTTYQQYEQLLAAFELALGCCATAHQAARLLLGLRDLERHLTFGVAPDVGTRPQWSQTELFRRMDGAVSRFALGQTLLATAPGPARPLPSPAEAEALLSQWLSQCERFGSISGLAAVQIRDLFAAQLAGLEQRAEVEAAHGALWGRLRAPTLRYEPGPAGPGQPASMEVFLQQLTDVALDRNQGLAAQELLALQVERMTASRAAPRLTP